MGDGVIDISRIRGLVEAAGYDGLVEVEIFSEANWWRKERERYPRRLRRAPAYSMLKPTRR